MSLFDGLLGNPKGEPAKNNDSPPTAENEKQDSSPEIAPEEADGEKKAEEGKVKVEPQCISTAQMEEIQKGQDAIRGAISKLGDTLDESIQRAIGKLGDSQDANLLEAVRDAIGQVGASMDENLSEMRSKMEGAEEKEAIIDKLYDELQAARNQISGKLIEPYAKCIMRYSQTLDEVVESLKSKVARLDSVPEEAKLQETMDALRWSQDQMAFLSRLILSELKDGFNLVKFTPEPGEPFDPKVCNCLGTTPMEREEQKGTIASVAQSGFRDMESGRIRIYPNVFVYK